MIDEEGRLMRDHPRTGVAAVVRVSGYGYVIGHG